MWESIHSDEQNETLVYLFPFFLFVFVRGHSFYFRMFQGKKGKGWGSLPSSWPSGEG